uniref:Uncharacterized protein n=1 Tax=Loigolactobacillus rennini TaxID=238013 RepID=A0A1K2I5J5_9LACO|nr:hypothetical protein LREN565_0725 [Loigolactobacillus rennini]
MVIKVNRALLVIDYLTVNFNCEAFVNIKIYIENQLVHNRLFSVKMLLKRKRKPLHILNAAVICDCNG